MVLSKKVVLVLLAFLFLQGCPLLEVDDSGADVEDPSSEVTNTDPSNTSETDPASENNEVLIDEGKKEEEKKKEEGEKKNEVVVTDSDGDTIDDDSDNCPTVSNKDQADDDLDSIGNACDNIDNRSLISVTKTYPIDSIPELSQVGKEDKSEFTITGLTPGSWYEFGVKNASDVIGLEVVDDNDENNDCDTGEEIYYNTSCRLKPSSDSMRMKVNGGNTTAGAVFSLTVVEIVPDFSREGTYVSEDDFTTYPVEKNSGENVWSHDGSVDWEISVYGIAGLTVGQVYQFTIFDMVGKSGSEETIIGVVAHHNSTDGIYGGCETDLSNSSTSCLFVASESTAIIGVFGDETVSGASFTWTLEESDVQLFTIETFANGGVEIDTEMYLYHSSDLVNEILYADDRNGYYSGMQFELTSGETYYIRVNEYDGLSGGYSIRVTEQGYGGASAVLPLDSTGEPNDTAVDAVLLEWNVIQDHTLTEGDVDWFKFTVP